MYEDQEQEPMPLQQPMIMGHTSEGALQYQLDSLEVVERVERIIKGEVEGIDEKTGARKWIQQFTPMLNNKGLNMIRGYLTMYLGGTKTFALTDVEGEYISDETIDIGRNIKAELMDNWTEYDVKDYAAASFIINIVCAAVYAVLKKGEDGTYLNFLKTTQQIQNIEHGTRSPQVNMQQEKQGIMGMLMGKKRR